MRNSNDNREDNDWPYHVYGTVFLIGVALAVGVGWLLH
jgi:hypothetical protein